MFRATLWSVLGLVVGMASSVANAQYFYSPVGYYASPVMRPVYAAPIPVGVSYYAPAPVYVSRPVYTPIVQSAYAEPITYAAPAPTISYASYAPAPISLDPVYATPAPVYVAPAPVYVTAAPVVVSRSYYAPITHQSLTVRPFSTTYRAHTWGGPSVYARSGPFHTVVRTRGW